MAPRTFIMSTQSNTIQLYHHPFSRAATVLWMLEELGLPYDLHFVDLKTGAQKDPAFLKLNPMGKLPTLVDGESVLTEVAAIGMYLADRYSPGVLAPALDDPARATYLRWILFGPSVIEPCAYAKHANWEYQPASAGWGTWEEMHAGIESAIGQGPWLLGDRFTMADVCLGATIRYLLRFGMLEKRERILAYSERLAARPALQRGNAANGAVIVERGLG